jgi:transposase
MTDQHKQTRIFVGIDWGSQTHQVCVIDANRSILLEAAFAHSGTGLAELVDEILRAANNEPARLAVAIEQPRGAVVETLLEKQISVFSINPKQLDRFRDRHSVSGAKDDRRDAYVLADSLRTDQPAFRQARLGDPLLVQLREFSRMQEELKAERIALGNRLREQLHRYFPQVLAIGSVYDARWLWELLELAPTPELAKKLSISKLRALLKTHRIRALTAEHVKEQLTARALYVAPGVTEATSRRVTLLIQRLRLAHDQKLQIERDIETTLDELCEAGADKPPSDARLLRSMPGLGTLVCATLLAEAWEPIQARDYSRLRILCGVAPVTKRSGKQYSVGMRSGCSGRLRTAIHYWIGNAIQRDAHWKAHYAALRAAGHSHGRAGRGVGDRLIGTLVAVLKSRTPYAADRRRSTGKFQPVRQIS